MSGAMSQRMGPLGSSLVIHLGGAIISALLILFLGGVNWQAMKSLPVPYFFAGLFGVILYFSFSYTLPRVGVAVTSSLLILTQMCIGLVLDNYGWLGAPVHPVSFLRLAGVGSILLGAFLVTK